MMGGGGGKSKKAVLFLRSRVRWYECLFFMAEIAILYFQGAGGGQGKLLSIGSKNVSRFNYDGERGILLAR